MCVRERERVYVEKGKIHIKKRERLHSLALVSDQSRRNTTNNVSLLLFQNFVVLSNSARSINLHIVGPMEDKLNVPYIPDNDTVTVSIKNVSRLMQIFTSAPCKHLFIADENA